MTTKKTVGRPKAPHNDRLLKILTKAGMTQKDLADRLKISKQSVNYWCSIGVPAARCLIVAQKLHCSLNDLRPDLYRR